MSIEQTPATIANMRRFEELNLRTIKHLADGTAIHVEPRRAVMLSFATGETFSASPGDYWLEPDENRPMTDCEGNPMVLVVERTEYDSALGQGRN